MDELEVAATARATTLRARATGARLATVEHLFAALAGLGIFDGLIVAAEGPELPLLDGGARSWCEAIAQLCIARRGPRLRVARKAVIEVGASRYEFAPGAGVEVEGTIDFNDDRLSPRAHWTGDAADFVARIAPARTFALARDVEELVARGLAHHVDPESVVVIGPEAIHHAGRPFFYDEPAPHKLLDLLGDAYLFGGPPLGLLRAHRPGHAANTFALRRACEEGILVSATADTGASPPSPSPAP